MARRFATTAMFSRKTPESGLHRHVKPSNDYTCLWKLEEHRHPVSHEKGLLISQESFQSSARRESDPRPSPWQGDVVPLYYSRIFNVPSDFHFCEGGGIIQKIISVGVNVIAVLIILSAQNRNRTSDTRIFSPLLYQLSYLGIERVMRIELTCSAWKADILPLNYTRK